MGWKGGTSITNIFTNFLSATGQVHSLAASRWYPVKQTMERSCVCLRIKQARLVYRDNEAGKGTAGYHHVFTVPSTVFRNWLGFWKLGHLGPLYYYYYLHLPTPCARTRCSDSSRKSSCKSTFYTQMVLIVVKLMPRYEKVFSVNPRADHENYQIKQRGRKGDGIRR